MSGEGQRAPVVYEFTMRGVVADLRQVGMTALQIAELLNQWGRLGTGWTAERVEAVRA